MQEKEADSREVQDLIDALETLMGSLETESRAKRRRTNKTKTKNSETVKEAEADVEACLQMLRDSPLNQEYLNKHGSLPSSTNRPCRRLYQELLRCIEQDDHTKLEVLDSLVHEACQALNQAADKLAQEQSASRHLAQANAVPNRNLYPRLDPCHAPQEAMNEFLDGAADQVDIACSQLTLEDIVNGGLDGIGACTVEDDEDKDEEYGSE